MAQYHKTLHELVSDLDDAASLWNIIVDVWPDAVAYEYGYPNAWIDRRSKHRLERLETEAEVCPLVPREKRSLPAQVDIFSSDSFLFKVYPSEPTWSSSWLRDAEMLSDLNLNQQLPDIYVDFERSTYNALDPFTRLDTHSGHVPIARTADDVPLSLGVGFIRAVSNSGEKREVNRFFRRLKKFATNKIARVDRSSLEVVERVERGGWTWVCPSALDWSRSHPLNFIDRQWKPIDWKPSV